AGPARSKSASNKPLEPLVVDRMGRHVNGNSSPVSFGRSDPGPRSNAGSVRSRLQFVVLLHEGRKSQVFTAPTAAAVRRPGASPRRRDPHGNHGNRLHQPKALGWPRSSRMRQKAFSIIRKCFANEACATSKKACATVEARIDGSAICATE